MKSFYIFFFFSLTCLFCRAQWNSDPLVGNIVSATTGKKINQLSVSDGKGGVIIAFIHDSLDFVDYNLSYSSIQVQRLRSDGSLAWGDASAAVRIDSATVTFGSYSNFPGDIMLVTEPDGKSGVFLAWARPGLPAWVQHVDSAGHLLWGKHGRQVSNEVANSNFPLLSLARSGDGLIVAWNAVRLSTGSQSKMYAQRFNANGEPTWLADGIQMAYNAGGRFGSLVSDGHDGAIAFFADNRNFQPNDYDIYAQRVDSNSALLWGVSGLPVCSRFGCQDFSFFSDFIANKNFAAADGNGGAIVIFRDTRNSKIDTIYGTLVENNYDIYAQKINAQGEPQWDTAGVPVTTQAENQTADRIVSDNHGGAVAMFTNWYTGLGVTPCCQRLNSVSGERMFADDGKIVYDDPAADLGNYSTLVADPAGNVVTSTTCIPAPYYNSRTFYQKFNSAGLSQWDSLLNHFNQGAIYPVTTITANPDGSAIGTWINSETGKLHALKIKASGRYFPEYISIANGNWNNPATWTDGQVPDENSRVVIQHQITITADASCHSLDVKPGANVIVKPAIHFTVLH